MEGMQSDSWSSEETLQDATHAARNGQDPWQNGQDPWRGNGMGCGQPCGTPTSYGPTRFSGSSNNFVPHMPAASTNAVNPNSGCQNGSHAGVDNAWFSMGGKGHTPPPGMETLDMTSAVGMMNPPHTMMNGFGRGMRMPDFPAHPIPFGPCGPPFFPQQLPFNYGGFPAMPFPSIPEWWWNQGYGGKGEGGQNVTKKDKNKKMRRKRQEEEERSRSEDEKRSASGGASQARRSEDPGDGGPPGSSPADTSDQDSSVDTSAIRSMLKRRVKQNMERPKSSLGSVKIEEFAGERSRYAKWKKAVEAQQQLYRLDEEELAMLIYLSSRRDARDCLDQRSITEYTRPGGLRLVWRLLDESFGETDEELFERAESEYALYRRLPGQPVAAYIGQMKRLKAQYARVDPDTHISDRAWAQRLLNRCSLGRRDRLDVFFSAGGLYEPLAIERALRHRCARVHEDERRTPQPSRFPKQSVVKPRSGEKGSGKGKKPFRRTYLAGEDEMEEDEAEEDLEGDEVAYQTYLQEMREEGCDTILEEPDLGEDGEGEESEDGEDEFLEAYTAGWKAKAKLGDKKKARGWRPKTSTLHQQLPDLWHKRSRRPPVPHVANVAIGRGIHSVPTWQMGKTNPMFPEARRMRMGSMPCTTPLR